MGVLLPIIALFLGTPQATSLSTQSNTQLLMLATIDPLSFRAAAEKLDLATYDILEQSIRQALGPVATTSLSATSKPQISLRSF